MGCLNQAAHVPMLSENRVGYRLEIGKSILQFQACQHGNLLANHLFNAELSRTNRMQIDQSDCMARPPKNGRDGTSGEPGAHDRHVNENTW
jgi:hypothetical protein